MPDEVAYLSFSIMQIDLARCFFERQHFKISSLEKGIGHFS
jgi:hypothetical protein